MRIAYNETFFEIQWTGSHASRGLSMATFGRAELNYPPFISHYTVFWCRSVRDSPVQCQGELHAQDVPAVKTSLNVTVPDGKANYQFAVEANQGSYGSGMVWSTCIVIANGNGSQIKQVEVVSVSTFTIDLSWTLPCSVQNGIITGYNIYYCPVVDRGDAAAHDGEEPGCLSESTFNFPFSIQISSKNWVHLCFILFFFSSPKQAHPVPFELALMSISTRSVTWRLILCIRL